MDPEIQKQICTIQRFLPLNQSDRTALLTRFSTNVLDERRKKKKAFTKADHDITMGKMAKVEEKVAELILHDHHESATMSRLKLEVHKMFPELVEKEINAVVKRYSDHIWQSLFNMSKHCYPEEHAEQSSFSVPLKLNLAAPGSEEPKALPGFV